MPFCVNSLEVPLRELAVVNAQRGSQHVNELAGEVVNVTPPWQAVFGIPVADKLYANAVALALYESSTPALVLDIAAHGVRNPATGA